jgi:23S rRNA (cytosine1962-C5)-methyltransferase
MTKRYPGLILKKGKESFLERFHPWLFSGAVASKEGDPREGDIVEIRSSSGRYLATGHYQQGSICARLFSFSQQEIGRTFWLEKIRAAYALREKLFLVQNPLTNAYRLVFSEGDGLPGLILDYYNGIYVMQCHSEGMYREKETVVSILQELYGETLRAVYDKSSSTLPGRGKNLPDIDISDTTDTSPVKISGKFLFGSGDRAEILETGHRFLVDFIRGQKTGFYLDQRSNRMFAQFYAKGRKVLNAFCYSGAFSVYALKGGAIQVHSADSSGQALEWAVENVELNGIEPGRHRTVEADMKRFLSETDETWDMIILDPPAFAKSHSVSHNALQAYIHINTAAMKRLNPGGILFTFSCSQAISREVFRSSLLTAALAAGRKAQVLHHLSQGPDHPVSIFHPEGEYLKGAVIGIE